MLGKMGVERENAMDAQTPHDFEAGAVHKTQPTPGRRKEVLYRRLMAFLVDPHDFKDGNRISVDRLDCLHTYSPLNQSQNLDQDVVGRNQPFAGGEKLFPDGIRARVVQIIRIHHGEKS